VKIRGENRADFDDEHHRILPLDVRPQHDERLFQRRPEQVRSKQALTPAQPPRLLGLFNGVPAR
jgi:hypothetical protein